MRERVGESRIKISVSRTSKKYMQNKDRNRSDI